MKYKVTAVVFAFGLMIMVVLGCVILWDGASLNSMAAEPIGHWVHETNSQGVEGDFWYENGVKQGVRYNADSTIDSSYRGKEIYDPESDAWYWLDADMEGKMAVSKDVYQESEAGIWGERFAENGTGIKIGKWVRYDEGGHMVKGWQTTDKGSWYFDTIYGTMAKGTVEIQGISYTFDMVTGVLAAGQTPVLEGWYTDETGKRYWYENGVRQGVRYHADGTPDLSYRGKEIYDPESDAWYWLDNVEQGAMAVSKDVYQESDGGDWSEKVNAAGQHVGKWVRYDEYGRMVKGWCTESDRAVYYFDPVYGTMAKGIVTIDGRTYEFDKDTGILKKRMGTDKEDTDGDMGTGDKDMDDAGTGTAANPLAARTMWEYVKSVDTDKNGEVISYTEREFNTRGGVVTLRGERTYDADGTLTEYSDYDEDGYMTEAMYCVGQVRDVITFEYDAETRLLKERIVTRNEMPYEAHVFRYDKDGNYTRVFYYQYDAGGERVPSFYIDYTYQNGNRTGYTRYEFSRLGKFYKSEQKKMEYRTYGDAAFLMQEETVHYTEGGDITNRTKAEYIRDDAGTLREILYYYGYRKNEYSPASHSYYTYDEYGNNTKIEGYNYVDGGEVLSDRKEYVYSPYRYTEEGVQYSGTEQTAFHSWTFYIYDSDRHSIGDVDFYRGEESLYNDLFVRFRENRYTQDADKKPVIDYFYLYQYNDDYAETREHAGENYLLSQQKYGGDGQLQTTRTYYYQKFRNRQQNLIQEDPSKAEKENSNGQANKY